MARKMIFAGGTATKRSSALRPRARLRRLLSVCLWAISLGLATAGAKAEPASYELAMTGKPPKIDGRLQDPCWKSATVVDHFVKLGGKALTGKEKVVTRALLTADENHLYFGIFCEEPLIDKLTLGHTKRDSKVWEDDDVEIMIVPCDPGGDRYVQLVVNPAGALMDAFLPDTRMPLELDYDSGARVGVTVGKKAWTVEISLPLANLPIESVTGPWRFHIARGRRTTGTFMTSLRTPVSGFHDLAAYARLTGIEKLHVPLGLKNFSFGQFSYGRNVCRFEVTGNKAMLTSMAIEVGGVPRALFDQAALQIMTGTMELPYNLMPADRGKKLVVKAFAGTRLLQSRIVSLDRLPEKMLGRARRSVFMFYLGNVAELVFPLHIAGSVDDPLTLAWTARDENGKVVGEGLTTPTGQNARIRLYWRRWRPGKYVVDCRLSRGGKELAHRQQPVYLVANPWEVTR